MRLDSAQQRTIRSVGRWAIAVVFVSILDLVVGLAHIFEGSMRDTIVTTAALVITAWQALSLAVAALAFGTRPTAERLEAGFGGLRTFAKVGVFALPVLLITAGATCEVTTNDVTDASGEFRGRQ